MTSFDALRDISFEVERGEFFGIIGRNGSGKSTLLKIIAGIYRPDSGSISVNGSLASFIELGVGFNPELSGYDNLVINGSLLGLSRREVLRRMDAIVDFAELDGFMDMKLRNYSSGMQVRLAFSIALQSEADILLTDEVLAVGDARFQEKCFEVFRERKRQNQTLVFVSHDMGAISDFCDRVLVLDSGEPVGIGETRTMARRYFQINEDQDGGVAGDGDQTAEDDPSIEILGAWVEAAPGVAAGLVVDHEEITISVRLRTLEFIEEPVLAVTIQDAAGTDVLDAPRGLEPLLLHAMRAGEERVVGFRFENPLPPGRYTVSCATADEPGKRFPSSRAYASFEVQSQQVQAEPRAEAVQHTELVVHMPEREHA